MEKKKIEDLFMKYLTVAEIAERWNISFRRVTLLCNEGRVHGAIKKEFMWLIPKYLNNPKVEYAVMINGEWGFGKTFFLMHSLMRIMGNVDNGKEKRRKCAYVSLYGAKSINEVSKEIMFQ